MAQTLRSSIKGALNRSIKGGLLSPAQFRGSTLDLDFAGAKSLKNQIGKKDVISFTRASSGTYVGSDGVIKTATTNLLLQSEDFSTTWTPGNLDSIAVNQIAAPDGKFTADKIIENLATSAHSVFSPLLSPGSVQLTASVYAKASERSRVAIQFFEGSNLGTTIYDLTGSGSVVSGAGAIVSVGNGWYRCSSTLTPAIGTNLRIFFILTEGSTITYTGDGTSGLYLWGAQLEQSDTVGEYVKTTSTINSAPRFDHDPTTGESLGLLVEESRTNLLEYSEDLPDFANTHATTPFDSSVVNPTGLTGSYKILADSGLSIAGVRIRKAKSSGNNIVVSAFVKKSTYRYVYIGFGGTGSSFTALFDIEPGLTSSRLLGQGGNGTFTNIDAGYQNLPNDWIRIWAVGTTAGIEGPTVGMGPNATTFNITNWTTAGTEEIYAWGLQYEDNVSFPTSYIPTEGSTVTRAADVASISGDNFGAFRTNLLEYSEEFDDAYWPKIRSSVIPNATLAPNNTFTADAIVEDTSSSTHILQADGGTNPVGGTTYTYSWYLKAGERTALMIQFGFDNGVWQGETVDIDLSNGILSNVSGFTTPPTVENVGNGWYRLSTTATAQASANGVIRMTPLVGGSAIYTGDGTSKYFIWGAQLEEGSTATDYIKSDVNFVSRASSATYYDANGVIQTAAVDEARTAAYLPDGNGNFVSAGPLLLEAAGTNLLTYSEDFSSGFSAFNSSIDVNQIVAPDGTSTADKFIPDNTANRHYIQFGLGSSLIQYTGSIYAKAGELSTITLRVGRSLSSSEGVKVDLTDGSLIYQGTNIDSASAENVGNGWYRIIVTNTCTVVGAQYFAISHDDQDLTAGDGTSGIYIWGAQLEQGSYATSYIPTTSSTATRAADVSTSAATTVFESDWYRQDEGTVFAETQLPAGAAVNTSSRSIIDVTDGSINNRISLRAIASLQTVDQLTVRSNGSTVAQFSSNGSAVSNASRKLAAVYRLDDYASWATGATSAATDTSGAIPVSNNQVTIGSSVSSSEFLSGTIRRFTYWPQRLPNETLQTITQ